MLQILILLLAHIGNSSKQGRFMPYNFFTPAAAGVQNIVPTNVAQSVTLVSGAAGAQITNTGTSTAYVLNAAGVTFATGIPVVPGATIYMGAGATISVIGLGSALTIVSGT